MYSIQRFEKHRYFQTIYQADSKSAVLEIFINKELPRFFKEEIRASYLMAEGYLPAVLEMNEFYQPGGIEEYQIIWTAFLQSLQLPSQEWQSSFFYSKNPDCISPLRDQGIYRGVIPTKNDLYNDLLRDPFHLFIAQSDVTKKERASLKEVETLLFSKIREENSKWFCAGIRSNFELILENMSPFPLEEWDEHF